MLYHSQILTEASGRIGGLVASHNRGGAYFRAAVMPVNPGTVYQEAVRNIVGQLAVLWSDTLTEAQRAGWVNYANNVPVTNRIGDARYLTGLNMYTRCNTARVQAAMDRIDDAPVIFNLGSYTAPSFAASEATQLISVTFDDTDEWCDLDGAAMLVYASRAISPSIEYFKGPYRLAGAILGDSGTPPTSPQTIALPFAAAEDQRLFFRANVTQDDGRYGEPFRGQCDCAA